MSSSDIYLEGLHVYNVPVYILIIYVNAVNADHVRFFLHKSSREDLFT